MNFFIFYFTEYVVKFVKLNVQSKRTSSNCHKFIQFSLRRSIDVEKVRFILRNDVFQFPFLQFFLWTLPPSLIEPNMIRGDGRLASVRGDTDLGASKACLHPIPRVPLSPFPPVSVFSSVSDSFLLLHPGFEFIHIV